MEQLLELFKRVFAQKIITITDLPIAGSNRKYLRLHTENTSYIGVIGTIVEENIAFIRLAQHFISQDLPVPKVLAVSEDNLCYIVQDLGDISLFDSIKDASISGVFNHQQKLLLHKTIALLPSLQYKGVDKLDFNDCFPQSIFNKRTVLWDLNYFKYCFLKPAGIECNEEYLENEFELFANTLLNEAFDTFMYRDFQTRNVMLVDNEPYFIDFQGGRKGPIYYDVASFVYQAKANFPADVREELIQTYLQHVQQYQLVDEQKFRNMLVQFVLFRNLQVLGAYGFRGLIERKKHFIESIPFAINNLRQLLEQVDFTQQYPYLVQQLISLINRFPERQKLTELSALVVKVNSFSYKKGIPEDDSGNGGGYVFDCRAIHNPGKYDEYKKLTGLDKPVIDFLEKDGEIIDFLEHVVALADKTVQRYIDRGFSSIMFSFGCTGGQHRSVYAAQHLAKYIASNYPVKVLLCHREQGINQQL